MFPWCSQLPRFFAILPVRCLVGRLTAPWTARGKSFRYAGVCLEHYSGGVITAQGGLLTRGRSRLMGGASSLFVTNVAFLASPYRAPPGGGFRTSGSVSDPRSGGGSLNAEGGERTSKNGCGFSCLATSLGMSWAWFRPSRQSPPAKAL